MRRIIGSLVAAMAICGTSTLAQTPALAQAAPQAAAPSGERMEGLGAVYSDKLEGRKTASGQVFSQSKMTAAHPTLAFGTRVKVTNTKNGKTAEVVINDRGPKQPDRVVDLSRAAAKELGIGPNAMAPVKLEVVAAAGAAKGK